MSPRQNQSIFAKQFAEFVVWLYSEGYEVTFGEAQRTEEMADIYVKKGLSSAGRKSLHLQKLAFDIFIFKNGDWLKDKNSLKHIGEKWESIDPLNSWGGFFTNRFDYPHFSRGLGKPERVR